jgi:3-deoxy-7-phosphoheptulonate synthase
MTDIVVDNVNVESQEILLTPEQLKSEVAMSESAAQTIASSREQIRNILDRKDHRLFLVVGPCSIHDPIAAVDYAKRLKALSEEVSDTLYLVMRVYFEKPRTSVGWKGLINDPYLNNTFQIEHGLKVGRQLLLDVTELGLPTSTEALDPISPQYMQDIIAWSAIGARTTESQTHREMASGLSSAVGFKNGTDGGLPVAINAITAAQNPHRFLGINNQGMASVIRTKGNPYAHMVLRGGSKGTNYQAEAVQACEQAMEKAGLPQNIMIDCSHANSSKDPARQPEVMKDVTEQIIDGNQSILGLMIESNIHWGNQSIPENLDDMEYGVSVTDACIDWETTETAIREMHDQLKAVLPKRLS